ncbi:hypothetical protein BOW53_15770 [Solemya pervernicosa gill symbiont]|uniref:Tll0287-like domain-containing protein n=1 Tax=Solemya pervernicosa gill symbiont TaxID=642797 RepID=A0A1T2KZV7_9GAMM|nr:DUF3365 domain-containing protein [Solemya pervernicosa gill symbiont]OOZ38383.1 hypothetical protein BOW53_15770 [Solemya pervernicosa gill symbiont]
MPSSKNHTALLLYWPLWVVLVSLLVGFSWWWNINAIERQALNLALERGRYTYKIIETARLWVAQHGVIYAKTSQATPPNPYLEVPERDIETPSGIKLTAINPAYMTRQLTDLLKEKEQFYVRLTSLKPLNPINEPDPWERDALNLFEQGEGEVLESVKSDQEQMVRYMAPLDVKPACMKCHEKQGYQVGDIRGGISVSFPLAQYSAATFEQRFNTNLIHLIAWFALSLLSATTVRLILRHEGVLEKARDDQEHLVKVRTRELQSEVQIRKRAEEKLQLMMNSTGAGSRYFFFVVRSRSQLRICRRRRLSRTNRLRFAIHGGQRGHFRS